MTQPTPYTRQYNFNDYQTTNPNSPLPGAMVDAELNAVKLTSDQTRQNLGQIQRDDGKLANQSVHKDAFDRDALAMLGLDSFNPRGNWAATTVYAANDLVNYNNATYPNYGCATNGNLAIMVANPEDLITGQRGTGETAVVTSTKAIDSYRGLKPTGEAGLTETSTTKGDD